MMKKNNLTIALATAVSLISLSAVASEIPTNAALMQAMDKVTGRVNKITVPVNGKISFGDFSLVLRACKKRPAEETPENFAFIDVTDKSFGSDEYNIFRGWIISSTPGINAIEHPIYDVWLLECQDATINEKDLLSAEDLAKRDSLPAKADMMTKEITTVESSETTVAAEDEPKVIHIKEFIQEDRDIEKDIKKAPAYISEPSSTYISDIEEGAEPENLLLFTKMQEISEDKNSHPQSSDDDLTKAIDAEMEELKLKQ